MKFQALNFVEVDISCMKTNRAVETMPFQQFLFALFYTGDLSKAFYVEGQNRTTTNQAPKAKVMGAPSLAYGWVFTKFYKKISFKLMTLSY